MLFWPNMWSLNTLLSTLLARWAITYRSMVWRPSFTVYVPYLLYVGGQVPLQDILNPAIAPAPVPMDDAAQPAQPTPPCDRTTNQNSIRQEVALPGMEMGLAIGGGVAPHPDIVEAPQDWRIGRWSAEGGGFRDR